LTFRLTTRKCRHPLAWAWARHGRRIEVVSLPRGLMRLVDMPYVKTLIVGLVGALIGAVLWIAVPILVSVLWFTRMSVATAGGGGIGAMSFGLVVPTGISTLLAALVGFVVAAGWRLRRFRRV
jgi:hypothetical protein